jgi:two-component system response regulator (stage 0 sporulation protein F)
MQSRNIGLPRDSTGRQPYRLTIAEDDHDIRDALARLLTEDGFEVTQVANGELLVQQLEGPHLPDMLILDHRMPGYSGLDILRVLHKWGWDIPVIMITAFGKEVFPVARSLGACAVFEKPFDHDDLRAAVYFYLRAPASSPARVPEGLGEDGDLDLVFSDSWEAFEVWVRQTIGGDFTWFARPRDTPESRQIIIDSIRAAMTSNDGAFPQRNEFLKRRSSG